MIYRRIVLSHMHVHRWDTLPGDLYFNFTPVRRAA